MKRFPSDPDILIYCDASSNRYLVCHKGAVVSERPITPADLCALYRFCLEAIDRGYRLSFRGTSMTLLTYQALAFLTVGFH